jgi:hypothetical protein
MQNTKRRQPYCKLHWFIGCHKCTPLGSDVDNGGGRCGGQQVTREISAPSLDFAENLKVLWKKVNS